jgi:Leu/Phe-tRNA-protein transferase
VKLGAVMLAAIRAVETWTTGSVVGGLVLLGVAVGAAALAIRVALRR